MNKNYYEILGISKDATDKDIKKAYRQLALKYHPDRNPDNPDAGNKFKEVSEAYSILSDPEKKKTYDRFGVYDPNMQNKNYSRGGGFGGFEDIFRDFGFGIGGGFAGFAGSSRGGRRTRTPEIQITTKISFEDSIKGVSKNIKFEYKDNCKDCDGTGGDISQGHLSCSDCNGTGKLNTMHGYVTIQLTCSACSGRGWSTKRSCATCNGEGKVAATHSIDLKIPGGVSSGNILRVRSKKASVITLVKVLVDESDKFVRSGNDIFSELNISLTEALLGCQREVDLVRKSYVVNIPKCIQPGSKLRIKGEGTTEVGGSRVGDHYIRVNLKMPKELTAEQEELIKEFNKTIV